MPRTTSPIIVKFPKEPIVRRLDSLIKVVNETRSHVDSELFFDLTKVEKISPIFLCLLAAVINEGVFNLGNKIFIRYPINRRAKELLKKADFFKDDPKKIQDRFLQVRRLSSSGLHSIQDIIELVGDNLKISSGLQDLMRVILSELFQNAIDHSGKELCYACAGIWGRSPQIHISLVDFGIGMPNKLRSMYANLIGDNDSNAIRLVLEEGKTTREKRVGGKGYEFIQQVLKANKGRLRIYTGKAKAIYSFDRSEYIIKNKKEFFAGTCVDIQLNRSKDSGYYLLGEKRESYF